MSKLKSPLLSLGSHGTIGDALTYQERLGYSFVREKPIPANPRTLPQMYQRWLYEDYAYLWTQQTASTRQEYASAGSRYHLTGFQYWMKYRLAHLPDIAAWWKLDSQSGALALDSSRNANHATIFGASLTEGIIDHAFYFDGLNDYLDAGTPQPLNITNALTLHCFVSSSDLTQFQVLFRKTNAYYLWIAKTTGRIRALIGTGGAWGVTLEGTTNICDGLNHHVALRYSDPLNLLQIWLDGALHAQNAAYLTSLGTNNNPLSLGAELPAIGNRLTGIIDNPMVHNVALDPLIIQRWSERRYPL